MTPWYAGGAMIGPSPLGRPSAAPEPRSGTVPAMMRRCARPGCPNRAVATLSYDYAAQVAWIEPLHTEAHPMVHDLCLAHADRLTPPRGWVRRDLRLEGTPFASTA